METLANCGGYWNCLGGVADPWALGTYNKGTNNEDPNADIKRKVRLILA